MQKIFSFLLAFLWCVVPLHATEEVTGSLVSEVVSVQPGSDFWLLIHLSMQPGTYINWKNPGDVGAAPTFEWSLPEGFEAQEIFWQTPSRIEMGTKTLFGYKDECFFLVDMRAPWGLNAGMEIPLAVTINYTLAQEVCKTATLSLNLKLQADEIAAIDRANEGVFARARSLLPQESASVIVRPQNGELEIESPEKDREFSKIESVKFFPNETKVFETNFAPKWKSANGGKTLVIDRPSHEGREVAGVVVVSFSPEAKKEAFAFDLALFSHKAEQAKTPFFSEVKTGFTALFEKVKDFIRSPLGTLIVFSFLGGLILNVMPCVLPIVSMKVFQLMNLVGQGRAVILKHALSFSFGIVVSFWLLALASFQLQYLGKVVGWGFQLQEPLFVSFLIIVLFILSLCLFGFFEIGTKFASFAGELESKVQKEIAPPAGKEPSCFASFCSGIFATFIATPCTGPLLGSAIGFTALLSPLASLIVFTSIGIGMAFPFILMGIFPVFVRLFPKPGKWMVAFKEFLGFLLLATILWLIWVLEAEVPALAIFKLVLSFVVIGFGLWIYRIWGGMERAAITRAIAKVIMVIICAGGIYILYDAVQSARMKAPEEEPVKKVTMRGAEWEPFSVERLQELRKERTPVFVNFSAKWCLLCQTNKLILESKAVREAFIKYGVVKMAADWTDGDETITKALRNLGRNGVPVYALYGTDPNVEPKILPELITETIVIDELKRTFESK